MEVLVYSLHNKIAHAGPSVICCSPIVFHGNLCVPRYSTDGGFGVSCHGPDNLTAVLLSIGTVIVCFYSVGRCVQ